MNVALPFTFYLYGQPFTSVNADTNGNLQFTSNRSRFNNVCLPYANFNNAIMGHWDDLTADDNCGPNCGVFTSTTGPVGSRVFTIEWVTSFFSGAGYVQFEVRLYEPAVAGDSMFDVYYNTVAQNGSSATVGVQRATGPQMTQFTCNTGGIVPGELLTFREPSCLGSANK